MARISRQVATLMGLLSLAALISKPSSADQLSVDEILKKVSETYQQVRSYQLSAEMITEIKAGEVRFNQGGAEDQRGTGGVMYPSSPPPTKSEVELAAANSGKYRLQVKDAKGEVLVVSDGQTTWTYAPKKKEYTEITRAAGAVAGQTKPDQKAETDAASPYESTLINRYRGLSKYSSNFVLEKESQFKAGGDKIDCYVLKMVTPQEKHEFWVDKVRFIVWRSIDSSPVPKAPNSAVLPGPGEIPYQRTLTVNLKVANLNAKLEDSLFTFVPPDKSKKVETVNAPTK